jgi:adenylate cyclase
MAKEIERKFLVRGDGWQVQVTKATRLQQAYVASMDDRSVRVRLANGTAATLTIKIGTSLIRDEFEYAIPASDAEELMQAAVGLVIRKTRHLVPLGGHTWEVDVFEGAHAGLVVAEVELDEAGDTLELPDWLGEEVTGQFRYSNQALATQYGQDRHGP